MTSAKCWKYNTFQATGALTEFDAGNLLNVIYLQNYTNSYISKGRPTYTQLKTEVAAFWVADSSFFSLTSSRVFAIITKLINASIAQSVEQLIRNQQVVCSSHITSSMESPE